MTLVGIGMTPMKCSRFHSLPSAQLESWGIRGDREFILLDPEGKPVSSGRHSRFLSLHVDYDQEQGALTITWPDGSRRSGPCELNPTVRSLNYLDMRVIEVQDVFGDWNKHLRSYSGLNVSLVKCVSPGQGVDVLPITLHTTASLAYLQRQLGALVDDRRFRSNLIIDADVPHIEDQWEGRLLAVGDALLRVRSSVPRCVVTQMNPETGRNDLRTLPVLSAYRKKVNLPDGLMPDYATPGFSSYAEVVRPGQISVGEAVSLVGEP